MFKAPSSSNRHSFYDRLMDGTEKLGMLGKDTRYNPRRVAALPSVERFFVGVVKTLVRLTDRVLDFGWDRVRFFFVRCRCAERSWALTSARSLWAGHAKPSPSPG